jgi:hypothetical protein
LRFWAVWVGTLASLGIAMWIPNVAALVQIAPISLVDWSMAAAIAIGSVIWRAHGRHR